MNINEQLLAQVMIALWAERTGRPVPGPPGLPGLSEQELIDFWAEPPARP